MNGTRDIVAPDLLANLVPIPGKSLFVALCEAARLHFGDKLTDIQLDVGLPPTYELGFRSAFDPNLTRVEKDLFTDIDALLSPAQRTALDESFEAEGRVELRDGSIARCHFGLAESGRYATIRFHRAVPFRFSELHLPDSLLDFFLSPQGFFLVSGPVRSGKTSILHAAIHELNLRVSDRRRTFIVVEDPSEYLHTSKNMIIRSREIALSARTFETASYGSLRSRPDGFILGEMRTPDTVEAAYRTAQYAGFVAGSVHAYNGIKTPERLINEQPNPKMAHEAIDSTFLGYLHVRLVERIDGGMAIAYEIYHHVPGRVDLSSPKAVNNALTTGGKNVPMEQTLEKMLHDEKSISHKTFDTVMRDFNPQFAAN